MKSDAEIRYLDSEIQRLAQEGKSISLSGLTLSAIDSVIDREKVEALGFDDSYDWHEYESSEGLSATSARRESPESIYDWTIEELDVSFRAYNCLKRAGIRTVKDIVERCREGQVGIRNMGKTNMDEVIQKIESLGGKI